MKRLLAYLLIALQIIFITILVLQLENIERKGEEITILTNYDPEFYSGLEFTNNVYVEYEINKVKASAWKIADELNSNHPVYVTLTENADGIHEVKLVTKKKPKKVASDDVLLKATYAYDDDQGNYYLFYGFQSLENVEQFGNFKEGDQLRVTILLSKWNQYKVTAIEAE